MKNSISLSDFSFSLTGYGVYKVTYTSPKTGISWSRTVNNMELIDLTKGEESPKRKDLEMLKRICKGLYN